MKYADSIALLPLLEFVHSFGMHVALRWSEILFGNAALLVCSWRAASLSVDVGASVFDWVDRLMSTSRHCRPLLKRASFPMSDASVVGVFESNMVLVLVFPLARRRRLFGACH